MGAIQNFEVQNLEIDHPRAAFLEQRERLARGGDNLRVGVLEIAPVNTNAQIGQILNVLKARNMRLRLAEAIFI